MGEPDACTCPAGDSRLYFEAPTYDDAGTTQTEVVLCEACGTGWTNVWTFKERRLHPTATKEE